MNTCTHRVFTRWTRWSKNIVYKRHETCVFTIFLLGLICSVLIFYLYGAMNYYLETSLTNLISDMHRLNFECPINFNNRNTSVRSKINDIRNYCNYNDALLGCSYWNPSIFPVNSRLYLIAVRQSTRQNCGGFIGTIITVLRLILKPAVSNVLIGSFNPDDLITKSNRNVYIRLSQYLPDPFNYDSRASHRGHEDPRWIADSDRLYLLTASERRSKPRLFLTRVVFNQKQTDNDDHNDLIDFGKTIELQTSFNAPYSQKNWMHIPLATSEKPEVYAHWLLFVFQVAPVLELVWVDPLSGMVVLYNNASYTHTAIGSLRGSSMFIVETNTTYLGFIHTSQPHAASRTGLVLNIYHSYLIRLAKERIPDSNLWKWTITHKTPPLAIPIARNRYAHRIQFITTITERNSEFWISMGDMDCDSYIVRMSKKSILNLLLLS